MSMGSPWAIPLIRVASTRGSSAALEISNATVAARARIATTARRIATRRTFV